MKVPPSARQAVAQGGRQENGERPQAYLSSTRWSISVRTAARRPSHLDQKSIRHQRGLFKPDNIATAALASTASLTGLGLGLARARARSDRSMWVVRATFLQNWILAKRTLERLFSLSKELVVKTHHLHLFRLSWFLSSVLPAGCTVPTAAGGAYTLPIGIVHVGRVLLVFFLSEN